MTVEKLNKETKMPEQKPLTVKELILELSGLVKNGDIKDDTPIALAADEEGNSFHYIYGGKIDFHSIQLVDKKPLLVLWPCTSYVEFDEEFDE